MKFVAFASGSFRTISWILLGIVLIITGIVFGIYSPWVQSSLRAKLVERLNREPGLEVKLDEFKLGFPLNIELGGVMLVQNGDTAVAAQSLKAEVALMPLFKGEVEVEEAFLQRARYQMGNADSLMMMVIKADTIELMPAKVKLSPLDIDVIDGRIAHGSVSMVSRPDTVIRPIKPKSDSEMMIKARHIRLEDFTYKMAMLPTIDSLGATIGTGAIAGGEIDLKQQTVKIGSFTGSRLNAAYIAPSAEQIAATPKTPVNPADTVPSLPWTVEIDSIHFTDSKGLYTTHGVTPLPGIDFGYIQADSMDLTVRNFYNQASIITLPITLQATERCGVRLNADGEFAMDAEGMHFRDFKVSTPNNTDLHADGMMGIGSLTSDPNLPLRLTADGGVSPADLNKMFPAFSPYLSMLPESPILLDLSALGTPSELNIAKANIKANNCVTLNTKGRLHDLFASSGPSGHLAFDGHIINVSKIINDLAKGSGLTVPPMTLDGYADLNGANIKANINATTLGGRLALDAKYNRNSEGYALDLTTNQFPVEAFMRDLGVGKVTAHLAANGNGFDFFSPKTNLDAKATIDDIVFNGYTYRGANLDAALHEGAADIKAGIDNKDVYAKIDAKGNLTGDTYDWTLSLSGDHIDLKALRFMDYPTEVALRLSADAQLTPKDKVIIANLKLGDLIYTDSIGTIDISNLTAHFASSDSLTTLSLINRDLTANASLPASLDSIMAQASVLSDQISRQIKNFSVNPDSLQKTIPKFDLTLNAGNDNLINDILRTRKMGISHAFLSASNDTTIAMDGKIIGLHLNETVLDTVGIDISQQAEKMQIVAKVDNAPGTMDQYAHIQLNCLLNQNKVALRASMQDVSNETGYDIGAMASISPDSVVTARVFPLTPTIGYKKWSVNLDNYIKYSLPTNKITANLRMRDENSSIALYTEAPTDSLTASTANDIVLKIGNIQLADWIVINPFAPPITGALSADMRVQWDGGSVINGNGYVSLDNFFYNKQRVGDFKGDLNVATNAAGSIRANVDLMVDGQKSMTLSGCLNDSTSTSPFNLDFSVIHFPLTVANPFLPEGLAKLSGAIDGEMQVSGDSDMPMLNGHLNFTDAAIKLIMTNTSYAFSDVEIPVVNNLVKFNQFSIKGTNENPLYVNGTVDIASLTSPKIDIKLNASNMMVVNSTKASQGADIFGKGYLDINASAKGDLDFLMVNANVSVLSGTNITYQMSEGVEKLQAPEESNMVKFVNFTDSVAVAQADSITSSSMLMVLDASLNINSGSTITVNLSTTNARNKLVVQPQGSLNFTSSPVTDSRLTGRVTINSGMVRYSLPVLLSEKQFTFDPGSYIAFNGDMLNPQLNISAVDKMKCNVTQEGQNSRLVNFDVGLKITGTLSTMNLSFDLSTNDDLAVANELQSMTPQQRASQAMNLLLYNVYTGPQTQASSNLNINPLFNFLQSQVNNWAANNIKGVDLTFGINQYDRTVNGSKSQTMNYSYQISKTLFNDRFKIAIGGNYSTDADVNDNLSNNLFNDISFEYYLNKSQTMLVKLFRKTGFESVLEGEVTRTGVGFVYKRRISNLVQMLPRFMWPKKYKNYRKSNNNNNDNKNDNNNSK